MTEETIEKIKAQNPGVELYRGEISFCDHEGKKHDLEFIYRRPSVADMEAYTKAVPKSSITAQSNLLAGLIVHPAAAEIITELAAYPPVVADFVNENISPFFGTAITSRSSRI